MLCPVHRTEMSEVGIGGGKKRVLCRECVAENRKTTGFAGEQLVGSSVKGTPLPI